VIARWAQDSGPRDAVWRADQVPAPAAELLRLGRARAAVVSSTPLAPAPGAPSAAHRDGPAVAHAVTEGGWRLHHGGPDPGDQQGQPRGQGLPAPVQARGRAARRELAPVLAPVQGPPLGMAAGRRRPDRHGHDLRVTQGGQALAPRAQRPSVFLVSSLTT
jgi:hypothetical protein